MTERQEPYESRDSRTDLWGPRGEILLGYPTDYAILKKTALEIGLIAEQEPLLNRRIA